MFECYILSSFVTFQQFSWLLEIKIFSMAKHLEDLVKTTECMIIHESDMGDD